MNTTEETVRQVTLTLKWIITVDDHAYRSRGRAGMVPVSRTRAMMKLGTLIIGGYEKDADLPKVKAFVLIGSTADRQTFASVEEAKAFVESQVPA